MSPCPGGGTPAPPGASWNAGKPHGGLHGAWCTDHSPASPWDHPQPTPPTPPPNWPSQGIPSRESSRLLSSWLVLKSPGWTRICLQPHAGPSHYTTPPARWCGGPAPLLDRKDNRGRGIATQHLRREHLTCPECSPISLPVDRPHSAVSCVHTLCGILHSNVYIFPFLLCL